MGGVMQRDTPQLLPCQAQGVGGDVHPLDAIVVPRPFQEAAEGATDIQEVAG